MQLKRRLSLAVLAAVADLTVGIAQAQSSATLYGQVDAWAGTTESLGQNRVWGINSGGVSTLHWGLKGSEDLGNDLKAIFTLEAFSHPDMGGSGHFGGDHFFVRSSSVGLRLNTWGSIKLSRNTPPYFVSTILSNLFIDSYAFSPMVFHTYLDSGSSGATGTSGLVGDSGWDNSITCSTSDMGGLTGILIYGADEQAGHNDQNKWGGSLLHFHDNSAATAALQQVRYDSAPGDLNNLMAGLSRQTAGQLGAAYNFGVVKLYGQYQYIRNTVGTGGAGDNGGQLDVSVPVDPGSILTSYVYTKMSGAVDVKRDIWATGYDYSLSKHADVYATYFRGKVSDLSTADTFGIGIHAKFQAFRDLLSLPPPVS